MMHKEAQLMKTAVNISNVTQVLDEFIVGMPEEYPVEMVYTLNHLTVQPPSEASLPAPPIAMHKFDSKCLHNEVWSMDNPPFPNKCFKFGPGGL